MRSNFRSLVRPKNTLVQPKKKDNKNILSLHEQEREDRRSDVGNSIAQSDTILAVPRQPLQDVFARRRLKQKVRKASTFVYGRVGFYSRILEVVFGSNWENGRWSTLVRTFKDLTAHLNSDENKKRIPIILPTMEEVNDVNKMLALAFGEKRAVWLIGYPTTVRKHLLASFQCFFFSAASKEEIEVLRDVVGLSDYEKNYLSRGKNAGIFASAFSLMFQEGKPSISPFVYFYI